MSGRPRKFVLWMAIPPTARHPHRVDGRVTSTLVRDERMNIGVIMNGTLTVKVEGCRNDEGHCYAAVFDAAEGFPKRGDLAVATAKSLIREGTATFEFGGLEQKRHAVVAFHDENDDGVLNMRFKVLPKEGFGFSNASAGLTGAPGFDECSFPVGESTGIVVEMQYLL